jgi:hypothetical protein
VFFVRRIVSAYLAASACENIFLFSTTQMRASVPVRWNEFCIGLSPVLTGVEDENVASACGVRTARKVSISPVFIDLFVTFSVFNNRQISLQLMTVEYSLRVGR